MDTLYYTLCTLYSELCTLWVQLMCDEYEQKTQRQRALQNKIEAVKKEHGEYAMSGERGIITLPLTQAFSPSSSLQLKPSRTSMTLWK